MIWLWFVTKFAGFFWKSIYASQVVPPIEYFNYTYTIPADLEVYVTNAKIGNFWKEDCNEKRPTTLDVWKNGFSKGFAISQENDMILFWAMVW